MSNTYFASFALNKGTEIVVSTIFNSSAAPVREHIKQTFQNNTVVAWDTNVLPSDNYLDNIIEETSEIEIEQYSVQNS